MIGAKQKVARVNQYLSTDTFTHNPLYPFQVACVKCDKHTLGKMASESVFKLRRLTLCPLYPHSLIGDWCYILKAYPWESGEDEYVIKHTLYPHYSPLSDGLFYM